jgi:hypothetical protein
LAAQKRVTKKEGNSRGLYSLRAYMMSSHSCNKEGKLGQRRQNRETEGLEPSVQFEQGKEQSENKAEEQRTHTELIMTLLLWSFVVVEGKTRRSGESSGRAGSDGSGIAERALNKPRNLTSTTPQLPRHLKNNSKKHNKKKRSEQR